MLSTNKKCAVIFCFRFLLWLSIFLNYYLKKKLFTHHIKMYY